MRFKAGFYSTVGALAVLSLGLAAVPAAAADQALIDAAKKEGSVTWYTTQIVNQFVAPAAAAFEKKYGIKVDYVRANSADVVLRIFNEATASSPWLPTLTFRAGAIVPGAYDRHVAFAPGNHGVAIEPSILLRKHVGWTGLGVWGDALYRWEHTIGADQYIAAAGLFQEIKGWELDVGFRHLQSISGENIVLGPATAPGTYNSAVNVGPSWYPTDVREIRDTIEAGFSYTTSKRRVRYAFHAYKAFDGSNTDSALWLGASVDVPFTVFRKAD